MLTAMSNRRRSLIVGQPAVQDKKRRFSFFGYRQPEPTVTVIPIVNTPGQNDDSPLEASALPISSGSTTSSSPVPRADSVSSTRSTFDDARSQPPAPSLNQVLEDTRTGFDVHEDGLPTYASAAYPTKPVTYGFIRFSPFAMVVSPEVAGMEQHGLYYISVGVNIWMPSMTVTTVRRGSREDGPVVASIELGISSSPATVTMGNVCHPLNAVFFRKSTTSNSRLYVLGDGRAIKWKLGANSWQAHIDSTPLATFVPNPPRKLTLQPAGHRLSDPIIVSLVILMREHLTPLAGMRGDSAQLFNYSPHYNYHED